MTCGAIMTKDPETVGEGEAVAAAARRLLDRHCVSLPVTDAQGRFVGLFGIDDLLCQLVPRVALAGGLSPNLRFIADDTNELRARYREVSQRRVGEIASRDVVTLYPDTPAIEALRLFCKTRETLAVVDRETRKLLGVISPADALRAMVGQ